MRLEEGGQFPDGKSELVLEMGLQVRGVPIQINKYEDVSTLTIVILNWTFSWYVILGLYE